mmetsp:Transcript_21362/g.46709  ORF Transcript_21362/g.46709 Transcript_21362/m.46709 type:complete len:244 (-) Transcript_21362:957-1688(-)
MQLVAPTLPSASSGAFMPRAAGLQSLNRSSTSARIARTCTLNSLKRDRSSFSARAADTLSLMALSPLSIAFSRLLSRAPSLLSSAASSSLSAFVATAFMMSSLRASRWRSSSAACAVSSASRSVVITTSLLLALRSFRTSTRSSIAPIDLMMLSALRSAWSMARLTATLTSSTVTAEATSCFLTDRSSSRILTSARLACSGEMAAATCVLKLSSLLSSATMWRLTSSTRLMTSLFASFISSTS